MKIQIVAMNDEEIEKARELCATLSRTTELPCSIAVMGLDPMEELKKAQDLADLKRYGSN